MNVTEFIIELHSFYIEKGRSMDWRNPDKSGIYDPYKILVSEIMLQQTQVERVKPKFNDFVKNFPNIESLSASSLQEVLQCWSGLGYNRRAKYLHDAAKALNGAEFPRTIDGLMQLKGIGYNSAAAILVYAFNIAVPFVETNIRTVYLHFFFREEDIVTDKEILKLVSDTLQSLEENKELLTSREFFWAVMDYGSFLKKNGVRNNPQSKHYSKQTEFEGSSRQLRGRIIRYVLSVSRDVSNLEIDRHVGRDTNTNAVIDTLVKEGLLKRKKNGTIRA